MFVTSAMVLFLSGAKEKGRLPRAASGLYLGEFHGLGE
jgi:hypothetical protein